jgi:hypothetical protein
MFWYKNSWRQLSYFNGRVKSTVWTQIKQCKVMWNERFIHVSENCDIRRYNPQDSRVFPFLRRLINRCQQEACREALGNTPPFSNIIIVLKCGSPRKQLFCSNNLLLLFFFFAKFVITFILKQKLSGIFQNIKSNSATGCEKRTCGTLGRRLATYATYDRSHLRPQKIIN